MIYTSEQIQEEMNKLGYIPTEKLVWEATSIINSLLSEGEGRKGQDISAICLAGPPGSGKTEFAKVIFKIAKNLVDQNCEFVSYQCDPTTGKENLFEDIRVTAVVQNDASRVIAEGALLKAISKVNEGKKVILFLDEYDKAREETDSFLLQFLQSGEISTGQTDIEKARIEKEEYKKNLQVILCKNDNREKLSGPLERRLEFIYLQEMQPNVFHQIASKLYPDDQKLVDFVAIVYDIMYDSKDKFDRLPACAEMLDAIKHAKDYMAWNAPNHIIYSKIFDCMVKDQNDRPMFLKILEKSKKDLGVDLQSIFNPKDKKNVPSIKEVVRDKMFKDYQQAFEAKLAEINALKEKIVEQGTLGKVKISEKLHFEEQTNVRSKIQGNFVQVGRVKRGVDITSGSLDWNLVATLSFDEFDAELYNEKMQSMAEKYDEMFVYENGYRYVYEGGEFNLNIIRTEEDGKTTINFYFDNAIVPIKVFNEIATFVYEISAGQNSNSKFTADTLVYSKRSLKDKKDVQTIYSNLYSVSTEVENANEGILEFASNYLDKNDKWTVKELKDITSQALNGNEIQ